MPRRAGADNGDLLGIGLAGLIQHLRHEARRGVKILLRDELLDIVDSDGGIDNTARAGRFTGLVADAAAGGREGVLLLYKLQRVGIAPP